MSDKPQVQISDMSEVHNKTTDAAKFFFRMGDDNYQHGGLSVIIRSSGGGGSLQGRLHASLEVAMRAAAAKWLAEVTNANAEGSK